ncbi:MAG: glycosyltransferase family 2 protein [Ferruginibacter sp.]|nr:glycosyltransferase family 2 protein [Ferruginibacter sp.]
MNNTPTELTILMPCLNEEMTLATCINKAKRFIERSKISAEILIADNGSTDNSIPLAQGLGARVVRIEQKGYGSALLGGIKAAHGKFIIMADSDDSYDFENLEPFVERLRSGVDFVIGNRFKGGIDDGAMPFLHRYLGNPVLSFIGRLFFSIPVNDFHCGLRGFNREKMLSVNLRTPGMEFASEMVVKSSLHKLRIEEVPTTLKKDGRNRKPHLNTWRDGWRHLRFLLIYSPRWLFFYPGLFLAVVGLVLSTILIISPIMIGRVKLDIHTLLYASFFTISGIQLIYVYSFSKLYGYVNKLFPEIQKPSILKYISLERGLLIGGLLIVAGITLSLISFFKWQGLGFGELYPSQTFRLVIPAVTTLLLGIQIIQNSFFMSTIQLMSKTES